ncbi:MAG: hypothetical protein HY240_10575 [Actinobacteria bacterium]|nr:hypothetical protein [Actinomycetota bacterium]
MLGVMPPPGGDLTLLQALGTLALLAALGLVYGFVMSLIYSRRSARVHELRRPGEIHKAA